MTDTLAVVTIVRGRHVHLRRQREALARSTRAPLAHVVVSMGDDDVPGVLEGGRDLPTKLVDLPASADRLPLAEARNVGVATAARLGADSVVLLDVDCIPEPTLVADYLRLLDQVAEPGPSVVTGRVRYLPEGLRDRDHTPERMREVGRDHPARVIPDDDLLPGDPHLLWSLNLAVTTAHWDLVGGFDQAYVGYGGEDTDFGQRLDAAGGTMWWTRLAGVFHQWHPVSSPPVEHVDDIVTNANLFHRKWGWYPMEGWLEEFRRRGLVERGHHGWRVAGPGTAPELRA